RHLHPPRRASARDRARGRACETALAAGDPRTAREPDAVAHRRRTRPAVTPSDAARHDRLELRAARTAGADVARAARRLRRLHARGCRSGLCGARRRRGRHHRRRRVLTPRPKPRSAQWVGRGDLETGLRLAGVLFRFWSIRGELTEGRRWLDQALQRDTPVPADVRAKALFAAGYTALGQGDLADSIRLFEDALAVYRGLADEAGVAARLVQLSWLLLAAGAPQHAPPRA